MKKNAIYFLFALLVMATAFVACDKDNNNDDQASGSASFEVTDAPIDDTNVKGTFVTITDLKVDGESVEGFNKMTIDLMAYQNGSTKLISTNEMDAKAYSNVTVVLDYDTDANGNSPGCYILDQDGTTKYALMSSTNASNEIMLNKGFEVKEDMESKMVMDFDLRKIVKRKQNQTSSDKYEFVSKAELESGVRMMDKEKTGTIMGNASGSLSGSDKVVVYAYKKGQYDKTTEMNGQGSSSIQFAKAMGSSEVDANGDYSLHFLEEGDYELHFASYKRSTTNNDELELDGMVNMTAGTNINLGSINVGSSSTVNVSSSMNGLLPL